MIAGPIWLGDQSSQTRTIIERLYAYSGDVNDAGQWSYYGKVGGALTTGNEDGGKHVSAQVLYALQHIGVTVPPPADAYWNGEAGPGDSYSDPGSGGPENAWTTRNTVFMTWNILHFARMLKDAGGVPAYGNSTHDWDLSHARPPQPRVPLRRGIRHGRAGGRGCLLRLPARRRSGDLVQVSGRRRPRQAQRIALVARNHVDVEVEHRLPGRRTTAVDQVDPFRAEPLMLALGDPLRRHGAGREVVVADGEQVGRVHLRHDERVAARRRVDVEERQRVLVLVDDRCR